MEQVRAASAASLLNVPTIHDIESISSTFYTDEARRMLAQKKKMSSGKARNERFLRCFTILVGSCQKRAGNAMATEIKR